MINFVFGSQWGDEGKGKIVDYLTEKSDIVVKHHGGANAGHTIYVDNEKYVFHLIPGGILHKNKICVIGNDTVLDLLTLKDELQILKEKNISYKNRLFIGERAHITLPYHRLLDVALEIKKGKAAVGTTARGIGPTYANKINRIGIVANDLLDKKILKNKITIANNEIIDIVKKVYGLDNKKIKEILSNFKYLDHSALDYYDQKTGLDVDKLVNKYYKIGQELKNNITDISLLLNQQLEKKKKVLAEGSHGILLDINYGTYPFVTTSVCIAGNVFSSIGTSPKYLDKSIGIVKSYTTRVGAGPFPTELNEDIGKYLQEKGKEFGATTGRPRRCGWLDLCIIRYSKMLNGMNEIALTKVDILTGLKKIKVCVGYRLKNGSIIKTVPYDLYNVKPIYKELPGWDQDITNIKKYKDLPLNLKKYIEFIEKEVGVKVKYISVGQNRDQTIIK